MIQRLVSGGQTGVDRAALDVAILLGIEHGGWCPRGRRAEDGRISDRYQLRETDSTNYAVRTEQNVVDSDATLILYRRPLSGGTRLTQRFANKHQRELLLVELGGGELGGGELGGGELGGGELGGGELGGGLRACVEQIANWINSVRPKTLNVAGPRESSHPTIYQDARVVLEKALRGDEP